MGEGNLKIETAMGAKRHSEKQKKAFPPGPERQFFLESGQAFSLTDSVVRLAKKGNPESNAWKDFSKFADLIWQQILGQEPEGPKFETFKKELIGTFLAIDFESMVYSETKESITEFIAKNHKKIRDFAVWSQGDVTPTGYQIVKAEQTKLFTGIHKALATEGGIERGEQTEFFNEKTRLLIDDAKFDRLEAFLREEIKKARFPIKLIIVEDSRGNFETGQRLCDRLITEFNLKAGQIEMVPVWAGYSRRAVEQEEKANNSGDPEKIAAFQSLKKSLNTISSLKDLNGPEFSEKLQDAIVLLDMDGVLLDERMLREEFGKIIYNTAVAELIKLNPELGESTASQELNLRIKQLLTKGQ